MVEITRFLRLLWPEGQPGNLHLLILPGAQTVTVPLADLDYCARTAELRDRPGSQVYFGVGACRGERRKRPDIVALPGFWLDIDLASPAHTAKSLPQSFEDAAQIFSAIPFEPTAIVHSGYGLHVWWLFDQPVTFPGDVTIHDFEKTAEALDALARAVCDERGWHLDHTHDAPRILRLPGTTNRKLGGAVEVQLLFDDGPRHTYAGMRAKLIRPPGRPVGWRKTTAAPAPETATAPAPELPPTLVDMHVLLDQLGRLDGSSGEIGRKLLACESLADSSRDDALQAAASVLAFLAPWNEIDDLVEILRPSLAIWAAEPGATKSLDEEEAKARDKLTRAQTDARRKRAEAAAENADVAGMFDALVQAAGPAKYTDDELRAICAMQHIPCGDDEDPVMRLRQRWIVTHTGANYLLTDKGYTPPVSKDNLMVAAAAALARSPVDFWIAKADGSMRRRKIGELLETYSTVAYMAEVDLALQASYFDAETSTFHEAPCPLLPLEPREDPRVAAWLAALGGVHHEKLLDWIATVTRLDEATCALYLSGPKSTGKTMLAQGLSRLWTTGGATGLEHVTGAWTHDLTRCPLVLADEALPWAPGKGHEWLRAFLGNKSRALTRKYLSSISMTGHPRLILAANNDDLLVGGDDIGGHDLEAVASRYLHIQVTEEASKYLAMTGGRRGTKGWVRGGAIARHALWLRDVRGPDIERGGRFLVEGEIGSMQAKLAVGSRSTALVAEWLVRHLHSLSEQVIQLVGNRVIIGGGEYLVNPAAIVDAWDMYIKSAKVLTSRALGVALHNLSSGTTEVRGVKLHRLKVELLLGEADKLLIGNREALLARLRGVVETPLTKGNAIDSVGPS